MRFGGTSGAHTERKQAIFYGNMPKQKNIQISKNASKKALKPLYINDFRASALAGAEGLEPSARGFGDRCSTN